MFAHRGFAVEHPENTIASFTVAIELGCSHIETDVHASADGVSIISHDDDLKRVAGRQGRVRDFTARELENIELGGGQGFVTLHRALELFPTTFFNIDIKTMDAAEPTIRAIVAANAQNRVLLTSFSERRRRRAVGALPGIATSASAPVFVGAALLAKVGAIALLRRWLSGVDALQIPERALQMRVSTPSMIDRFQRAGVEVHFWTINDAASMARLLAAGADGIVTDRADVGWGVVRSRGSWEQKKSR